MKSVRSRSYRGVKSVRGVRGRIVGLVIIVKIRRSLGGQGGCGRRVCIGSVS